MPRAGSPQMPPGGAVPPAPMDIGEVANPPFAVLPDPANVFRRRASRFDALAPGSHLGPYLTFLAHVARAQDAAQAAAPAVVLPAPDGLLRSYANAMPPVAAGQVELDPVFDTTFAGFLDHLAAADMPDRSREAVAALHQQPAATRRALADATLLSSDPPDDVARHVLLSAGLQVHFTRLAAALDGARLQPVADAACPACGSAPAVSMVVGWPGAYGTRFCACALCATLWHVVRIKCLMCGEDGAVAYHGIDGQGAAEAGPDTIKGETCDGCHGYVKILHQHKDPAVEPIADDVASLGLDILLRADGYRRGGANPFLTGY